MRIPSRLLAAIVMLASLLISGTARATSTHDWSGFYLGGTIGLGDFYTGIDDKGCSLTCSSQHFSKLGFAVGVTTGYNWTIGSHGLLGIAQQGRQQRPKAIPERAISGGCDRRVPDHGEQRLRRTN
jgi:hypothetical protein